MIEAMLASVSKVEAESFFLVFPVLQASDNAKEAEDNARKAKNTVKMVLGTITALLEQLGKNSAPHKHHSLKDG